MRMSSNLPFQRVDQQLQTRAKDFATENAILLDSLIETAWPT